MRTFDELLDDLVHRARWERDEVESAKQALRSMRAADVAAERERCAKIVERINGWAGTREISAEIRGETQILRA